MKTCPGCDERVETYAPGVSYTQLEPYGPYWHIKCAEEELKEREPVARVERHRLAHREPGTAERLELAEGEFKL